MPNEKDTIRIRETFEITQQKLSDITGIPLATIKNWESRHCMPSYMAKLIWKTLAAELCNDEE